MQHDINREIQSICPSLVLLHELELIHQFGVRGISSGNTAKRATLEETGLCYLTPRKSYFKHCLGFITPYDLLHVSVDWVT